MLWFDWRWKIIPSVLDEERHGILSPHIRTSRWSLLRKEQFSHTKSQAENSPQLLNQCAQNRNSRKCGKIHHKRRFPRLLLPLSKLTHGFSAAQAESFPAMAKHSSCRDCIEILVSCKGWQKNRGFLKERLESRRSLFQGRSENSHQMISALIWALLASSAPAALLYTSG